eukprot:maker-scaffold1627_size33010-snap-gene-0.10 protein:Tk02024 transcript:maker-scaffold1627_size33010-snap-gene-0.10-mRNA-1 annotation:"tetraspanin-18"
MALVVCAFGIYALIDGQAVTALVESADESLSINVYTTAAIILIVVSVIVIIVTFLGCCGALKENRCMLGIYFTLLLTMFIVLIVGAVIGYSQSLDELKKPLISSTTKYDADSDNKKISTLTKAWNRVQTDFKCCGVDSYQDWNGNRYLEGKGVEVPTSCCARDGISNQDDCQKNPSKADYKLEGCYQKLKDNIKSHSNKIMIVAVVIIVIMFLNMIFAFVLCTMAT